MGHLEDIERFSREYWEVKAKLLKRRNDAIRRARADGVARVLIEERSKLSGHQIFRICSDKQ